MSSEPNQPHQPKLHYDDFDDALHDLVIALGGNKKVGARLWANMPQDDAANRLRACLNKSRREKLDHHETLTLLGWARDLGFHGAKHFVDDSTGYNRTPPIDPKQEKDKAVEAVRAAAEALVRASAALERVQNAATSLALVKL